MARGDYVSNFCRRTAVIRVSLSNLGSFALHMISARSLSTMAGSDLNYKLEYSSNGAQWSYLYRLDSTNDDHPEMYMSVEVQQRFKNDTTLSDYDRMIIQRLACRRFHIPGNTYWEDYIYWFNNNQTFVCFWLADPRHPLGRRERVINLIASLSFGLAATCSVVLWFYYHQKNFDRVLFHFFGFKVTTGTLTLLSFSGPFHVAFDLGIYFIQACPPCRTGGILANHLPKSHRQCWLWLGAHVAFLITIAALSLAINFTLVRASLAADGTAQNITTIPQYYSFLGLYLAEVIVSNFIAFPIVTFIVFSGVLGCGVIPGIGGRPYQVKKWERMQERKKQKELLKKATGSSGEMAGYHSPIAYV